MCKFPFPACFGIPACPAQEFPLLAVGQSWQPWLGGQEELFSSHSLLLVFNLSAWGLTPWREREQDAGGQNPQHPSGEESPACRQGHLPTCTDILYRHGCICVDNMVF